MRPAYRQISGDLRKFQLLSPPQVQQTCDKLEKVQDLTDKAIWARARPMSAKEFGDEVHWLVAQQIGTPGKNINPNFVAEISLTKMAQDGVPPEEIERIRRFGFPYGTPASVRVDALERKGENTVCVYDIKTGNAKLNPARIAEIFNNVRSIYGDAVKIIITEVRPNVPYRFSPK